MGKPTPIVEACTDPMPNVEACTDSIQTHRTKPDLSSYVDDPLDYIPTAVETCMRLQALSLSLSIFFPYFEISRKLSS